MLTGETNLGDKNHGETREQSIKDTRASGFEVQTKITKIVTSSIKSNSFSANLQIK